MTITERLEAIKAEVETAGKEAAERVEAAVATHLPAIMDDDLMQSVEGAAGLPGWARTFLAGLVTEGCAKLAAHVAADASAPVAADPAAPAPAAAPAEADVPEAPAQDGPAV